MDFLTLARRRRSIRKFSPRPVEKEIISKILEAASWAPSACNQQLWHFIIIEKEERKQQLVREAGASGLVARAPVLIIACYHGGNIREGYQSSSAAVQNLLLAAADLGVGSLWLNSFGKEKKIKNILGIPEAFFINSFILLGYPAGPLPSAPPRKPLERICHDDSFQEKSPDLFTHDPSAWSLEAIRSYQHYFCRKTDLGEPVDLMAGAGMPLVKKLARSLKGRGADLFSYDGSFLSLLPEEDLTTVDLSPETSAYTRAASGGTAVHAAVMPGAKLPLDDHAADWITCFYKLERIPPGAWEDLFREVRRVLAPGGRFVLTFRRSGSLYGLFHRLLIRARSDDIRKTALYSFFGPYRPLSPRRVKKALAVSGFKVSCRTFFLFPPEFETVAMLFKQFRRSGGKTFLHGTGERGALSRLAGWIARLQGQRRLPPGSTVCIEAE